LVPPRSFCLIQNPVVRDEEGDVVVDANGAYILRHGDEEVRIEVAEPFPLYPGETLYGKVSPLQVVAPNTALRLRAVRDFEQKKAGDEWLFKGPGTYIPRVDVQVVEIVRAIIIKPNEALRLRARRPTATRKAGQEWLVRVPGAYLPDVDEEVRETVKAYILTPQKALQLEALETFIDVRESKRNVGEQWLVTHMDASTHIPDVYERVVGEVPVTTLTSRQFCVVLDPVDPNGTRNQLGKRELRKGETSFFLNPGERLEGGRPQNVYVLDSEEALLLCAREAYDEGKETRKPGDRWMIFGPTDYVPPVQVEVIEKRRAIPLDENEGIYVRDIKTGRVRAVTGQSYMLSSYEELWKKECTAVVESLLQNEISRDRHASSASVAPRDPTRVITYRTPHNSAVQVYDYKSKMARVIFGPDLVMLGPDEQFTVNSLSGDVPKRPHVIKSLALLLGPDFMTDVVVVETSDHARLSLKLSYNWYFEIDQANPSKIFSVPDFVGDACKAIASRVRGAVATETFDNFHKKSADIIRDAVFEEGNRFVFTQNNLVITNIDIQSVEPVDSRTRDALQKSVQLAIEITTKSQEASARHEAERREQVAKGKLERQKIADEALAEEQRTALLKLQAASAVIEASGHATAEAHAKAESMSIEGEAAVKQAELSAEAEKIRVESDLAQKIDKQKAHISHQAALNALEIEKAEDLAKIEADKFKGIIDAVGSDTIEAIATAAPSQQAELLASLSLNSFMVTDGNNPINLFNTARGLIGGH